MMVDDGLETEEPIEDDVKELQDGNFYHPDFINLDDDSCSGTFAITWDVRRANLAGLEYRDKSSAICLPLMGVLQLCIFCILYQPYFLF